VKEKSWEGGRITNRRECAAGLEEKCCSADARRELRILPDARDKKKKTKTGVGTRAKRLAETEGQSNRDSGSRGATTQSEGARRTYRRRLWTGPNWRWSKLRTEGETDKKAASGRSSIRDAVSAENLGAHRRGEVGIGGLRKEKKN